MTPPPNERIKIMTKIVETKVSDWKKPESGSAIEVANGVFLQTLEQTQMCKYYGIPGVLPKVDAAHHTSVVKTVMEATTNNPVKFLIEEETNHVISPIDPRSEWISDDQFSTMYQKTTGLGYAPELISSKWGDSAFKVRFENGADVLGDIIHKEMIFERLPQGGVVTSMALLRQICTNGAVIPEKETSELSRRRPFEEEEIQQYIAASSQFDLDAYLRGKWFKDGEPVEASVGDFYGMRSLLMKATDKETADISYPTAPIVDFYKAQGVELAKINNNLRNRIPSGLSYYDCFNILTHGMKQATHRSFELDSEVAGWGFGKHIKGLRQTEIAVRGKPQFDPAEIRRLRGDRIAA